MSERDIQNRIIKYLKQTYPNAIVFKLTEETLCGIPDVLFIHGGRTIFFEVKKPGGNIRPLQVSVIRRINENGGEAGIVYSVEDMQKFIQSF